MKNIPLQDPKRQYLQLKENIDQQIVAALESGRWLFGENVLAFEKDFATYCGAELSITVANGTDAIELSLLAANAKGREVITVANAGGYTTTACRAMGAIPVYVDVEEDTLLMSPQAALNAVTSQTAAIVATHLYGRFADIETLRTGLSSLQRDDIILIEDCAQAHGIEHKGIKGGCFGDIGTFSFYPTKNLGAMGDGGAIICNDRTLADQLQQLRQYGWSKRYQSDIPYGRNSRMDEIQAAILRVKLTYLDRWNAIRRSIVEKYATSAAGKLQIWHDNSNAFVAHLAIARHPERDHIREKLQEAGVTTDIHYPILDCDQPSQVGLPKTVHDLSVSRRTVNEIFTLPCFPEMSEAEIEYVCRQLSLIST